MLLKAIITLIKSREIISAAIDSTKYNVVADNGTIELYIMNKGHIPPVVISSDMIVNITPSGNLLFRKEGETFEVQFFYNMFTELNLLDVFDYYKKETAPKQELIFEFNIEKLDNATQHILLGSGDEYCELVKDTIQWQKHGKLQATLQINGIPVPAKGFEDYLIQCWEQAKEKAGANEMDRRVKEKAEAILKERAQSVLDVLVDVEDKLNNINDTVKWSWEEDAPQA